MDNEGWKRFVGQQVVVDTSSPYVYLGTLSAVEDHFVMLTEVDAHDRGEGPSTKEQYIMDAKRHGIRANRKEVSVRKSLIVSISRLADILVY